MTGNSTPIQGLAITALVVVSCFALLRLWAVGQAVPGIDYYQFWVVGEAIEHDGLVNPYADEERERIGALYLDRALASLPPHDDNLVNRFAAAAQARAVLETYSTPFLYTGVHWLSSGDYETDFNRWRILSLVAFVLGVLGIAQTVGMAWLPSLGLLAGLLLFFAPLQSETQVQNVNSVQLGLLAIAIALLQREDSASAQVAAGATLAIGAMFKPNVGLVVVFLFAAIAMSGKTHRTLLVAGGIAAGMSFAFATSSVFLGSMNSWLDWISAATSIPPNIITTEMGNYAPLAFAFGESSNGLSAIFIVLLSIPVLAALWTKRDAEASALEMTTLAGLGCLIFVLTANLVWEHYFILAAPLLVAAWVPGLSSASSGAGARLLHRTLPGLALVGLLATPTFEISGLSHDIYFPLVQGGGTVILYGLAIRRLFAPREVSAA